MAMLSQVSKWGNSQGIRISKKILQSANIKLDDEVEIIVRNNAIIIMPTNKKTLEWYLEGYEDEPDRYNWGADEPKGRELL
jgi:antitoxin MazE